MLTPAVQGTASTLNSSKALLNGSDQLAKCFVHTVIPTGNERLSDPPLTTGLQVYQELFQSAVGLAGIGQNFDGNGRYVRSTAGGGSDRVATGVAARRRPAVRQRGAPVAGHAPRLPRQAAAAGPQRPLLQERAARPQRRQDRGAGRETRDQRPSHRLRRHRVLIVAAIAVTVYILEHQPSFVFGQTYYTVRAPFATAAAVTVRPGPGGDDRRGPGRPGRRRHAAERPGRGDDEHLQAVRADLPRRHGAAAAAHAAEGHVPGAGSGHPQRRRGPQRRVAVGRPTPSRTSTSRRSCPRWTPTPATTWCCCCPRAPRPSTTRAPPQVPPSRAAVADLRGTLKRFAPLDRETAALRHAAGDPPAQHPPGDPQPQPGGQRLRRRGERAGLADQRVGHQLLGDRRQRHPARADPDRVPADAAPDAADARQGPGLRQRQHHHAAGAPAVRPQPGPRPEGLAAAVPRHHAGDREPAAAVQRGRAAAGAHPGAGSAQAQGHHPGAVELHLGAQHPVQRARPPVRRSAELPVLGLVAGPHRRQPGGRPGRQRRGAAGHLHGHLRRAELLREPAAAQQRAARASSSTCSTRPTSASCPGVTPIPGTSLLNCPSTP